ncbi:hypothetical protein R6Q59_009718 [Mikania micrantha]
MRCVGPPPSILFSKQIIQNRQDSWLEFKGFIYGYVTHICFSLLDYIYRPFKLFLVFNSLDSQLGAAQMELGLGKSIKDEAILGEAELGFDSLLRTTNQPPTK